MSEPLPFQQISGGAPLDRRYARQSLKIAQKVYRNGVLLDNPVIQGVSTSTTSTGATGTYGLNFPVAFTTVPVLILTAAAGVINVTAVTATGFSFTMSQLSGAAWPNLTVVSLYYEAIGT